MHLHLIRHGQTQATEQHRYCGQSDLPLIPQGLAQLAANKASGIYPNITHCQMYTTGLLRTTQTLAALYGDVPYTVLPGFQEVNFGIFELGHYDQLQHEPAYQTWIGGDFFHNIPPGGESFAQFQRRVLAQLDALLSAKEDALVIAHGGTIATIMGQLFPQEQRTHYQWAPPPGHGYSVILGQSNTYTKITDYS